MRFQGARLCFSHGGAPPAWRTVPHFRKAPLCLRQTRGASCFPFGFPMFFYRFAPPSLCACLVPNAAPAPAQRAGDRGLRGVRCPGMVPRHTCLGCRAAPGFVRGSLIFLLFLKDFIVTAGHNKSTTIYMLFGWFLFLPGILRAEHRNLSDI